MDDFSIRYIKHALFDDAEIELSPAAQFNDIGLGWGDPNLLKSYREYGPNSVWFWDGNAYTHGLLWGGCVESVDEMLRHGVPIPSLEQFADIILMLETSEEFPAASYVFRVIRGLESRAFYRKFRGF